MWRTGFFGVGLVQLLALPMLRCLHITGRAMQVPCCPSALSEQVS